MRHLVISDIHANWDALQAVLGDASGLYDSIVNCGDVVGYGPDPNEVTDWCRATPQLILRGNHDKACSGIADLSWFNPVAQAAAVWTAGALTPANLEYIAALAQGPIETDEFQVFHGSPLDEDEYLLDRNAVDHALPGLTRQVSFFGHTHVQGGFLVNRRQIVPLSRCLLRLEERMGYLLNPGSVGQPRDQDPRAAYAIYDEGEQTFDMRRVEYDVRAVYKRIMDARLPEMLGSRLFRGL